MRPLPVWGAPASRDMTIARLYTKITRNSHTNDLQSSLSGFSSGILRNIQQDIVTSNGIGTASLQRGKPERENSGAFAEQIELDSKEA